VNTLDGEVEVEKSSIISIFTIWNMMAGPSVLTLPFAYYNSGLAVGFLVTYLTYAATLRTCIYVKRTTEPGKDYFATVEKYLGTRM
jgi:amino acid permease